MKKQELTITAYKVLLCEDFCASSIVKKTNEVKDIYCLGDSFD